MFFLFQINSDERTKEPNLSSVSKIILKCEKSQKLRFYSKNVFQTTFDCAVFYDCYSHAKHNSRQSHMFHFINRRLMRLVCVHHAHEFQVF